MQTLLYSNPSSSGAAHRSKDSPGLQCPALRRHAAARPSLRLAAVVTDQAVPEGHKGLHGFLYGEAGAEVHDQQGQYHFRQVGSSLWHIFRQCQPKVGARGVKPALVPEMASACWAV